MRSIKTFQSLRHHTFCDVITYIVVKDSTARSYWLYNTADATINLYYEGIGYTYGYIANRYCRNTSIFWITLTKKEQILLNPVLNYNK